jgi:hypothetical protein
MARVSISSRSAIRAGPVTVYLDMNGMKVLA